MKKFIIQSNKFIAFALIVLFIQACGPQGQKRQVVTSNQRADLEQLIKQAQQAEPAQRNPILVQASGLLVLEARFEKSQELLIRVDQQYLTPQQMDDFHLFYGETLYGLGAFEASLKQLNSVVSPQQKDVVWQIRHSQSLADSYLANGNSFESAKIRIALEDVIDSAELLQSNNEKIWESLNYIDKNFLKSLITDFNTQRLNGWLEIVYINKEWGHSPQKLLGQLEQWKKRYPLHPSQVHQPETLQRAASAELFSPKHIAVLLPLTGKNATVGMMIQDGILAAHYRQSSAEEAPQISFYDTTKNLSALIAYEQAMKDGADFIIGPLTKESVESLLTQEAMTVPILALNRLENQRFKHADVFQFGLPVEDEAVQAAHYAYERGFRKAVAFLPANGVGERAEKSFKEYFEQLGGELIETQTYDQFKELKSNVQQMLGVDESMKRKSALQSLLGRNLEFEMRRRQDADFIFTVANPRMGRSIKPFIDFHFAHDLPVIATSSIYSGKEEPKKNIDLNGIEFPDMPLIVSQKQEFIETREALAKIQPDALDARGRFFAMGFDAYQLLEQLAILRAFPEYRWNGLAGELGVDEYGLVHRYLTWVKFNKGLPQVVKEREVPKVEEAKETQLPKVSASK